MPAQILIHRITEGIETDDRVQAVLDTADKRRLGAGRGSRSGERRCAILGRALMRLELGDRLRCDPSELVIERGHQGKPYIASPNTRWHFNLAHSGDMVAIALSDNAPIGIDVEWRGRRTRVDQLAAHYFGTHEHSQLVGLSRDLRRYRFFQIWTVKESVTKALGESLWRTLSGIEVCGLGGSEPELRLSGAANGASSLAWWHMDLDNQYSLGVVRLAADSHMPTVLTVAADGRRIPATESADAAGYRECLNMP
jgi:4'-phosphopantetheinyl transferase